MSGIYKRVVSKAAATAFISLAVSFAISYAVVPLLGGTLDGAGLVMTLVLPVVIAFPASAFQFLQYERQALLKRKLASTVGELETSNRLLRQANAELTLERSQDPMTRLLTDDAFRLVLANAATYPDIGQLVRLKIDGFEAFEAAFGVTAGEMAIFAVAAAIRQALRSDDFAGRIGPAEFVVFMPAATPILGSLMVNSVVAAASVASFATPGGPSAALTLSVGGIACAPGFDIQAALDRCGFQLQSAEASGGNCSRWSAEQGLPLYGGF